MAQVNPQLTEIITLLTNGFTSIGAKIDAQTTLLNSWTEKIDLANEWLGSIDSQFNGLRNATNQVRDTLNGALPGIEVNNQARQVDILDRFTSLIDLLGGVKGDTTILTEGTATIISRLVEIVTATDATQGNVDILNNNVAGNFATLLGFLDVMNTNAAANAEYLKKAFCGDCDAPSPAIDSGGFLCRTAAAGTTGSDATVELPITYNIGPGVVGAVGDSARLRIISATGPMDTINFYNGPAFSGSPTAMSVGGPYIEYVISAKPGTLVVTPVTPGPFNLTITQCFLAAPS